MTCAVGLSAPGVSGVAGTAANGCRRGLCGFLASKSRFFGIIAGRFFLKLGVYQGDIIFRSPVLGHCFA